MTIRFDHPELLWLLLLAPPLALLGWRAMNSLDRTRRTAALVLRILVLSLMVLILAGAQAVHRHTDLTVVALVDQSESVEQFAHFPPREPGGRPVGSDAWVRAWLTRAADRRRADDCGGDGVERRRHYERHDHPGNESMHSLCLVGIGDDCECCPLPAGNERSK